jgi:hypothetical protein
VSPPADGTGYVELVYSVSPVDLAETDPVAVADIYVPGLVDYALYRAFSKEFPAGDDNKANMHLAAFSTLVKGTPAEAAKLAAEMGLPVPYNLKDRAAVVNVHPGVGRHC